MNQSTDTTTAQARNDDAVGRYLTVRAATEALARGRCRPRTAACSPCPTPARQMASGAYQLVLRDLHPGAARADFARSTRRFACCSIPTTRALGRQHPRRSAGLLTRPSLATVLAYRADVVDARMLRLLQQDGLPEPIWSLLELGCSTSSSTRSCC